MLVAPSVGKAKAASICPSRSCGRASGCRGRIRLSERGSYLVDEIHETPGVTKVLASFKERQVRNHLLLLYVLQERLCRVGIDVGTDSFLKHLNN